MACTSGKVAKLFSWPGQPGLTANFLELIFFRDDITTLTEIK